jgi:predicted MFS family arabinose efflux permease
LSIPRSVAVLGSVSAVPREQNWRHMTHLRQCAASRRGRAPQKRLGVQITLKLQVPRGPRARPTGEARRPAKAEAFSPLPKWAAIGTRPLEVDNPLVRAAQPALGFPESQTATICTETEITPERARHLDGAGRQGARVLMAGRMTSASEGAAAPAWRRNVPLLAASQALMLSAIVLSMTLGAVLGAALSPDKGLATLPIALMVVGTAVASLPAAATMRRHGRRAGFLLGAALGAMGSAACALALHQSSFALFVFGHFLLGTYQGFANYYRFAAVEAVDPNQASRAVSWVVAGGLVAAFAGPQLAQWGRDWIAGEQFVGSYVAQGALSVLALALLARLRPNPVPSGPQGTARPLREILGQPALRASVLGSAVGYAVMIMVMTATPLAMLGCGLPGDAVKPVIQWHVVGMFAPSFFTGSLVQRFGAPRIMQAGFVLLFAHVVVSLSGLEFLHFLSALILLGVGWNFAFVGGTSLLTQTYRPGEQLKVQAVNEFAVFGLVALATLSAGWLYDRFGWSVLVMAVVPVLLIAFVAVWHVDRGMRRRPVPV